MKTLIVFHSDGHVTKFRNFQGATIYPSGFLYIKWIDIDDSEHITHVENVTGLSLED